MRYLMFSFFIILLFTLSCRKDKVNQICSSNFGNYCPDQYFQRSEPYPDTFHKSNTELQCIFTPDYESLEEYVYNEPVINPNNSFEFAFIRQNPSDIMSIPELCIYDFCDNSIDIIALDVLSGISWSTKNWIIFTKSNNELFKIKANGDSLTQLTSTGDYNNYAKWSPSGGKYLYFDASSSGTFPMKISDISGTHIDSIDFPMSSWTWLNEEEIIYSNVGNSELRKYNLQSSNIETIINQSTIGPSGDHLHINENQEIYTQIDQGLIRVDLSGNFDFIDSNYLTYNSGYAQQLTDSTILLQRFITDTTYYDDCIEYWGTYISILNEVTGTERRIKIPE